MLAFLPPLSILENYNVGDLYFRYQRNVVFTSLLTV